MAALRAVFARTHGIGIRSPIRAVAGERLEGMSALLTGSALQTLVPQCAAGFADTAGWPWQGALSCSLPAGSCLLRPAAVAATSTVVSLAFDNNTLSQYTLGYQQALQPHGVNATFLRQQREREQQFVTKYMSWSQLSALAAGAMKSAVRPLMAPA